MNFKGDVLKVTLISPVYPYPNKGVYVGIERHVYELATNLKKAKVDIKIITTYWNGGRQRDEYEGIPIYRSVDSRYKYGKIGLIFDLHCYSFGMNLLEYRDLIKQSDIVHALGPISSINDLKTLRIPIITHFHHFESIDNPKDLLCKPFHKLIEKNAYKNSTLMFTPSASSKNDLVNKFNINDDHVCVIPHGIDSQKFYPSKTEKKQDIKLLYVGNLEKRKGLYYLIEAIRLVVDKHRNVKLFLVGKGSEKDELISHISRLQLEEYVQLCGFLDDDSLLKFYQSSDIFVFPSLKEGFGFVLLEAMACGIPVISTNVSAMPEVVGDSGILVNPRDPEDLSKKIIFLLENEDQRKVLSQKSLDRIKNHFSWERIVGLYLTKYNECIWRNQK
jgi:glycosyltransferase involved in cell wall biosynthesis